MEERLQIEALSVSLRTPAGTVEAVRGVSLTVREGEVLAIVGESGCGKSMLCKSILGLLPKNAAVTGGHIRVNGTDITGYSERELNRLRGRVFSMVFQDPMTSLDPTMTVGAQIAEAVRLHAPRLPREAVRARVLSLLEQVGIRRPAQRAGLYPYHLSGGMRQRVVLAIALAGDPQILLADEPTTALDVTIQAQILDLLREIQKKRRTAAILVSHDMSVVARAADRVAVMYAGQIVEIGTTGEIIRDPRHPYTRGLLRALPAWAEKGQPLYTIPGMPPSLIDPPGGDAFACRNENALAIDYREAPPMFRITETHAAATWLLDPRAAAIPSAPPAEKAARTEPPFVPDADAPPIAEVRGLTQRFRLDRRTSILAADDISFCIRKGEIFGLVGESGSGKSTVARCLMNLQKPTAGEVLFEGIDTLDPAQVRRHRRRLQSARQIIFQDSASSLNPRMRAADIITEPMKLHRRTPPRGSWRAEAAFQLRHVGLDESYLDKRPAEMSGGQRQRVAIARALSMEPALLVADEPIASLDVSIQAQIVNLFAHLRREHGFSILFIAHDLVMVRYLCDRIGVMLQGRLVEVAEAAELFAHPLHPYTQFLLAAVPDPDPLRARCAAAPAEAPRFDTRGRLTEVSPGHFVLRHREEETADGA